MRADRGRILDQSLADQYVESSQADRGCDRIAAERAAVVARRENLHHLATGQKQRHRQQPAAERFAKHDAVRRHAIVLARQEPAGPAKPGLDLVAQQQHAIAAARDASGKSSRLRRDSLAAAR